MGMLLFQKELDGVGRSWSQLESRWKMSQQTWMLFIKESRQPEKEQARHIVAGQVRWMRCPCKLTIGNRQPISVNHHHHHHIVAAAEALSSFIHTTYILHTHYIHTTYIHMKVYIVLNTHTYMYIPKYSALGMEVVLGIYHLAYG